MYSIYNSGSLLLLLGRAISVTLLAARINDQSKVIMPIIYNCPSVDYCVEVSSKLKRKFFETVIIVSHLYDEKIYLQNSIG